MKLGFILNGEDVEIHIEANVRLIEILRRRFGLLGAKSGCLNGHCGNCLVIFNGLVSPACLIPAFRLEGSEVITIEGFSQTDEYQDIIKGFNHTNLKTCGYCETGKILSIESLLERIHRPSREEILGNFNGIKCRCTNIDTLAEAVNIIAGIRRERLYGRS
jgi:carbon-monoxide dehydrogenase small subunit